MLREKGLMKDPVSGLMLPREFVDQKQALKKLIDELVEKAVSSSHITRNYYLLLHMRFDKFNGNEFKVSPPIATYKIPTFMSNTMVFWVSPKSGICELLWMVPAKKAGEKKLRVEFNKSGVAYLQAKGAMPS